MSDIQEVLVQFGQILRKLREDKGVSQVALSLKAGLHYNYVGILERGLQNPSLLVILNIAHALNVPATELIKGIDLDRALAVKKATRATYMILAENSEIAFQNTRDENKTDKKAGSKAKTTAKKTTKKK